MISIVTAYYNRRKLFINTLESIKAVCDDVEFEFIAVDDGSFEDERIEDLTKEYSFLKVIRIEKEDKWYYNPCVPFNIGFSHAKGEIILLQNPECIHFGPILKYVQTQLQADQYLSFGCFSLNEILTRNFCNIDRVDMEKQISSSNYPVKCDGENGWYNHSVYRPVGYHFCAAIHTNNLARLGGFDERFARGIAFDDDEFLFRIKRMGLDVKIIDTPFVLHQNHYNPNVTINADSLALKEKLWNRNRLLFENVTKSTDTCEVNFISEINNKDSNQFSYNNTYKYRRSLLGYVEKIYSRRQARIIAKFFLKVLSYIKF